MKWKLKIILIVALILLLMQNSGATKETIKEIENGVSETVTLDSDEYLAYSFLAEDREKINISIKVMNGGAIDTFLMNSAWFISFQSTMAGSPNKDYRAYMTSQGKNIKSKFYSFIFDHGDRYFLIIDNTFRIGDVIPSGPVDVDIKIIRETPTVSGFDMTSGIFAILFIFIFRRRL